jgi:hypothetical protein
MDNLLEYRQISTGTNGVIGEEWEADEVDDQEQHFNEG